MMDTEDVHTALIDHEKTLQDYAARLEKLEAAALGLNGMTLGQIEAMAERLGAAAKTIRDAQALLGGGRAPDPALAQLAGSQPLPEVDPTSLAAHRLRQLQPPEMPGGGSKLKLSPAEAKARADLLNQFKPVDDPGLPDDIAAMERGT